MDQFLAPEKVISGSRNWPIITVSGSRNWHKTSVSGSKISGSRNWQNGSVSGPRNWHKTSVSGARNWREMSVSASGARNWHIMSVSGARNWHYGRAELYPIYILEVNMGSVPRSLNIHSWDLMIAYFLQALWSPMCFLQQYMGPVPLGI